MGRTRKFLRYNKPVSYTHLDVYKRQVQQGELIAAVGATGNVTGPHCHLEIKINGQYVNPANYVGTVYNR